MAAGYAGNTATNQSRMGHLYRKRSNIEKSLEIAATEKWVLIWKSLPDQQERSIKSAPFSTSTGRWYESIRKGALVDFRPAADMYEQQTSY